VIPPSDISRTKPLVRLILNQIGRRLTEKLEGDPAKRRRHELLMMLDEFPALGSLDFFETRLISWRVTASEPTSSPKVSIRFPRHTAKSIPSWTTATSGLRFRRMTSGRRNAYRMLSVQPLNCAHNATTPVTGFRPGWRT